ncbi:DUF4145 domain-containing protein [bacterium]|nr:DUF4145 domain-containing protein [bacterium]
MAKMQTRTMFQVAIKDLVDICPHCESRAHFQLLFSDSYQEGDDSIIYYAIFRCVPCKKLILKTFKFCKNEFSNNNLSAVGWQDKFPKEKAPNVSKFDGAVPLNALEDFIEGVICLHNKCPRAAVSIFRRSLQAALIDRGASRKLDLIEQIKNASFLTKDIKEWAYSIRIFGNWAAHPQSDNLKDVDEKIALETKLFLEEFFNYVYVMPLRVTNARKNTSLD